MALKLMRGARPSPRHRLAGSTPHRAVQAPLQYGTVPPQNSMFLNDQDGDCVTAEECVNINNWTYRQTGKCLLISNAEVQQWAASHGVLNGANLTQVLDAMLQIRKNGLTSPAAVHYDGPAHSVDWTHRPTLTSAIFASKGSVKIGVDGDDLGKVITQIRNGWYLDSVQGPFQEDHCVGLIGYGPANYTFAQCGVSVPGGVNPASFTYLLDTWSTVGVVAAGVIERTGWVGEAWLRVPSSITVAVGGKGMSAKTLSPVNPQAQRLLRLAKRKQVLHHVDKYLAQKFSKSVGNLLVRRKITIARRAIASYKAGVIPPSILASLIAALTLLAAKEPKIAPEINIIISIIQLVGPLV